MPQLDISAFTTQILWLVAIFFTFYVLLLKFILPKIGKILKFRTSYKAFVSTQKPVVDNSDKLLLIEQLTSIVESNNRFIDSANKEIEHNIKSESEFVLLNESLKKQNSFFLKSIESSFIKKYLLEHSSNPK